MEISNTKPVIVLGMHRSGTSLTMKLCSLLGVELGSNLVPAREDNAEGFFEHAEIVELNESIFTCYGLNSQDVVSLPDGWWHHEPIQIIKNRIVSVLKRDFSNKKIWGLKDPRLCLLMPMWQEIFKEISVSPIFIVAFRHPEEVAASLVKRDFMTVERGMMLWMNYVLGAHLYTQRSKTLWLNFDQIQNNPLKVMNKLKSFSPEHFPQDVHKETASSAVRKDLRHHVIRREATIPDLIKKLYFLSKLKSHGLFVPGRCFVKIQRELQCYIRPLAETIWAMHPPSAVWRQTIEAREKENIYLREKLRTLTDRGKE